MKVSQHDVTTQSLCAGTEGRRLKHWLCESEWRACCTHLDTRVSYTPPVYRWVCIKQFECKFLDLQITVV